MLPLSTRSDPACGFDHKALESRGPNGVRNHFGTGVFGRSGEHTMAWKFRGRSGRAWLDTSLQRRDIEASFATTAKSPTGYPANPDR